MMMLILPRYVVLVDAWWSRHRPRRRLHVRQPLPLLRHQDAHVVASNWGATRRKYEGCPLLDKALPSNRYNVIFCARRPRNPKPAKGAGALPSASPLYSAKLMCSCVASKRA